MAAFSGGDGLELRCVGLNEIRDGPKDEFGIVCFVRRFEILIGSSGISYFRGTRNPPTYYIIFGN